MAEKAILIDTSKCIACKGCQIACKQWNELGAGRSEFFASTEGYQNPSDLSYHTYNLIMFHSAVKDNGDPDWLFRKKQCLHCTDANCFTNCHTRGYNAIQRDDTGFIFVDRDKCVGCQSCLNGIPELSLPGCPFGIPRYAIPTGEEVLDEGVDPNKMYKCWGCVDRQTDGIEPACVKTCPTDCATYGDRDAQVAKAQARKAELEANGTTAYLYGVDELGGLHYIYVLLREPSYYGLPTLPSSNVSSRRAYLKYVKELGKQSLKKVSSV